MTEKRHTIDWNKVNGNQKNLYYLKTESALHNIEIPASIISCNNPNCQSEQCKLALQNFFDRIISTMKECSNRIFDDKTNVKKHTVMYLDGMNMPKNHTILLEMHSFCGMKMAGQGRNTMLTI